MFIEDLLTNPHTPLLLGTIIGLANALNFTLVAEGVETKDQATIMLGLGCHVMQGYLFSRPVSGNEIPALMAVNFLQEVKNRPAQKTSLLRLHSRLAKLGQPHSLTLDY